MPIRTVHICYRLSFGFQSFSRVMSFLMFYYWQELCSGSPNFRTNIFIYVAHKFTVKHSPWSNSLCSTISTICMYVYSCVLCKCVSQIYRNARQQLLSSFWAFSLSVPLSLPPTISSFLIVFVAIDISFVSLVPRICSTRERCIDRIGTCCRNKNRCRRRSRLWCTRQQKRIRDSRRVPKCAKLNKTSSNYDNDDNKIWKHDARQIRLSQIGQSYV